MLKDKFRAKNKTKGIKNMILRPLNPIFLPYLSINLPPMESEKIWHSIWTAQRKLYWLGVVYRSRINPKIGQPVDMLKSIKALINTNRAKVGFSRKGARMFRKEKLEGNRFEMPFDEGVKSDLASVLPFGFVSRNQNTEIIPARRNPTPPML